MGEKYEKLTEHLAALDGHFWLAKFEEIEKILGLPLPPSARRHQAWWSNQERGHSQAWVLNGWRTAKLDLEGEEVVFYRMKSVREAGEPVQSSFANAPLTFDQAKAGLAQHYGVDPSQIEIILKA